MNRLFIDTSNSKKIIIQIKKGNKLFEEIGEYETPRADTVLLLLDEVLKKAYLQIDEIDSISVHEGPGSYTGLRVGVSIANALSFVLQKEINHKKLGEYIVPVYE